MTTDAPAPDEPRPLLDELRRAAFCVPRIGAFDEVGLVALRSDARGVTDALVALLLGLPFWVAGFLGSDVVAGLLGDPVNLVSSALAFYLIGSLSPLAWAGVASLVIGHPERFARCGAGLLWWGAGAQILTAPATALGASGVLSAAALEGVELVVGVWAAVVAAWIIGRTLGIPGLLAGLLILLDMLGSDALALFLLSP